MEKAIPSRILIAEKAFLLALAALAACVITGQCLTRETKRQVRYRHSLAYPKFQEKELIQVSSLDRG